MKQALLLLAAFMYMNISIAQPGSLDHAFGLGGKRTTVLGYHNLSYGLSMQLQTDGKIVVGGGDYDGFYHNMAIARYKTNGSLDSSFGTNGSTMPYIGYDNWFPESMAIQKDGKIVVTGSVPVSFSDSRVLVMRFKSDGSVDSSFGTNGYVITGNSAIAWSGAIAIQYDSLILVGGTILSGGYSSFALWRLRSDGAFDPAFGTNGRVTTAVLLNDVGRALAVQDDNKIILGGLDNDGGGSDFTLVRYKPDGSVDSSFGTDGIVTTDFNSGTDQINELLLQHDGKIIAAGSASYGADILFALARYNSDGSLDQGFGFGGLDTVSFGSGLYEYGLAAALQSNGKIIMAGSAADDFAVVRFNDDGSPDSTFGTGGKVKTKFISAVYTSTPYSVQVQNDGNIVVAGQTFNTTGNGLGYIALARYLGDPVSGIPEKESMMHFPDIYPNPTPGKFTVTMSGYNSNAQIKVYNSLSQIIYQSVVNGNAYVDIGNAPAGIYFLHLTTDRGSFVKKFVKE